VGIWLSLTFVLVAPVAASGQATVRWLPTALVEGSFLWIVVTPDRALVPVRGMLSGEPLHFEPAAGGSYRALAAVPIALPDSLPLEIHLAADSNNVEGLIVWVPLARRRVPVERIRTSAKFARPPDSALAARIAVERERIREVQHATHQRPRMWYGEFARPRTSAITSRFGTRRVVNGVEGGRHWGTDLAGQTGAPVRASNRGVVALAGAFFYGGCLVYVDHGAGLVTGYLHLSEMLVAEGDTVETGQVIGRVGATGRVTGPHLHWLASYGRVPVDALSLLEVEPVEELGAPAPRAAAAQTPNGRSPAACN
jgi:murein DD-endopeptidase MepM/ murein hydrolase activator NlpD